LGLNVLEDKETYIDNCNCFVINHAWKSRTRDLIFNL